MFLTERLRLLSPIGGIPKQSSQDSGACIESISSNGCISGEISLCVSKVLNDLS